jgi:hypothetical protein
MASRDNNISKSDQPKKYLKNRILFLGPWIQKYEPETMPSGNGYVFNGSGSIVEVDERDVPTVLSTRSGMNPCPGCSESMLFEILD